MSKKRFVIWYLRSFDLSRYEFITVITRDREQLQLRYGQVMNKYGFEFVSCACVTATTATIILA